MIKILTYKKDYISKNGVVKTATNILLQCGDCKVLIKPVFDKDYQKLLTIANIVGEVLNEKK